jgi:hypothetical protein
MAVMRLSGSFGSQYLAVYVNDAERLWLDPAMRCGDLERCALRPGNVHSADRWDEHRHKAFGCRAFEQKLRERCVQMTEKSVIFAQNGPRLYLQAQRLRLAKETEWRQNYAQCGVHLGNLGFT